MAQRAYHGKAIIKPPGSERDVYELPVLLASSITEYIENASTYLVNEFGHDDFRITQAEEYRSYA